MHTPQSDRRDLENKSLALPTQREEGDQVQKTGKKFSLQHVNLTIWLLIPRASLLMRQLKLQAAYGLVI